MSGGPFYPAADPGTSGELFFNTHVGGGGNNAARYPGLGVANATDLTADRYWSLLWFFTTLPTGTAYFDLGAMADVQAGDLSVDPQWASMAFDEDFSAGTLNAEGPDPDSRVGGNGADGDNSTFGWDTNDDDVMLKSRWTLNADTVVAGEAIIMGLKIVNADTDVAAVVTLFPMIVFV